MKKTFEELVEPYYKQSHNGFEEWVNYDDVLVLMKLIRKETIKECKNALIHPSDFEADFCGADLLDLNSIKL